MTQSPDKAAFEAKLQSYVGKEVGPPAIGNDRVNEAMIRHWCVALGDRNPVYTDSDGAGRSVHGGIVAPPTMLQVWTMRGLVTEDASAERAPDLQQDLHDFLGESGYPAVVATNCEQEYFRYLRPGDVVSSRTVIESISQEKATALGIGYFIDTRTRFLDGDGETVGSMLFRVLKFKAHEQPRPAATEEAAAAKPTRPRPPMGHDNTWWWEGVQRGELLIQRCKSCGVLRHPPRPMCGKCQSTDWDSQIASGEATVFSYVVLHHPQFPGFEYPIVAAVIELAEGTRIVSNVVGVKHTDVRIGMPVRLSIEAVEEDWKLPLFRPAG